MSTLHLKSEIAQREFSDLGCGSCLHSNQASRKPSIGYNHITKRLRLAIMRSFHCYEDLPTCGEGGRPLHGGLFQYQVSTSESQRVLASFIG